MIELEHEIIEEKDDFLHDDTLKKLLSAGPDSIDCPVSIADEENNAHNQLMKDFAAAVGAVEIQSPGRKATDGSFEREWRMSMKKSEKKKNQTIILARGDSSEDVDLDGFSDIGEEDFDEALTPAPVRHNSIVGKETSV